MGTMQTEGMRHPGMAHIPCVRDRSSLAHIIIPYLALRSPMWLCRYALHVRCIHMCVTYVMHTYRTGRSGSLFASYFLLLTSYFLLLKTPCWLAGIASRAYILVCTRSSHPSGPASRPRINGKGRKQVSQPYALHSASGAELGLYKGLAP